jgi:ZIP family zinc transporter
LITAIQYAGAPTRLGAMSAAAMVPMAPSATGPTGLGFGALLALGAIAGFTIFLGLPVARLKPKTPGPQSFLTALALGVLLFLIWDILSHALEPIEGALKAGTQSGQWGGFAGLLALLIVGLVVGLVGLVLFEVATQHRPPDGPRTPTQLALLVATGLGLHNFSEGLAIGQGAAAGAVGFALVLVVGFGLHNITEGFAIAAPLAAAEARPSWAFLGLAGLIGGGPTFLGTLVGYRVTAQPASVLFLALAAGALFYVIGETFTACRRFRAQVWAAWGIVVGFLLAYGTDLLLTAGGM